MIALQCAGRTLGARRLEARIYLIKSLTGLVLGLVSCPDPGGETGIYFQQFLPQKNGQIYANLWLFPEDPDYQRFALQEIRFRVLGTFQQTQKGICPIVNVGFIGAPFHIRTVPTHSIGAWYKKVLLATNGENELLVMNECEPYLFRYQVEGSRYHPYSPTLISIAGYLPPPVSPEENLENWNGMPLDFTLLIRLAIQDNLLVLSWNQPSQNYSEDAIN